MTFPANTTRYLLFLCNLIFLVSAIAVAAVALLIALSLFQHEIFLQKNFSSPPIIVLIVCAIICLISFFGCCGVIRESKCCLYMFSLFLLVIVIVEVLAGAYVFSSRNEISGTVQHRMMDLMRNYNQTNATAVTKSWDALQHDFHCCGVKNYTDWYAVLPTEALPHSCCVNLSLEKKCYAKDIQKAPGCFFRFSQFVQSKTLTLGVIVLSVGILQLLCVIASGLLAHHFKQQYEAV